MALQRQGTAAIGPTVCLPQTTPHSQTSPSRTANSLRLGETDLHHQRRSRLPRTAKIGRTARCRPILLTPSPLGTTPLWQSETTARYCSPVSSRPFWGRSHLFLEAEFK